MLTGSSREALTHKFPKLSIVYVWGYNGYCRLGLGNQKDVLTPQIVPQAGRLLVKLPEDKHSYKNLAVRRAAQAISWCQGGSRSFKLCGNRPAGHVLCGRKGWVLASRFMFDTSPTILSFHFSGRIRAMVGTILSCGVLRSSQRFPFLLALTMT